MTSNQSSRRVADRAADSVILKEEVMLTTEVGGGGEKAEDNQNIASGIALAILSMGFLKKMKMSGLLNI